VKRFAKFWYVLLVLVILVGLAVLHFFQGLGVRYTKNEPKESDLVGVYRPDLLTRFLIKEQSNSPAMNREIKLSADGEIELVNVLEWLNGGKTNIEGRTLLSTNGTWRVEKYKNNWVIISKYGEQNESMTDYFELVGEKPPYKIQVFNWHTSAPYFFVQSRD